MSKRAGVVLFLALALAFLIVNRGAYKGFFQDDELDNISWTPHTGLADFARGLAAPSFQSQNFRPAGHLYFKLMERWAGMRFPPYVFGVQLLHLLNVWLLWLVARRLGARPFAAGAAAALFAFHMALFETLWKPMYVFDVLCATFSLSCLLLFARRRWVLSFVCYWLAYKSKELAVMLPLVLACYEYGYGERRWKPLLVFFAASLSFGLQGMLLNPNQDNAYTFRFTLPALATTSVFYAGRVFLLPWAGFALLAVPWMVPDRRVRFGLAFFGLLLAPLLLLPGRLFSAYCYVPFAGLALAFAGAAGLVRRRWIALFFVVWIPFSYYHLRTQRRAKLAADDLIRVYVTSLAEFARLHPETGAYVFNATPAGFGRWGTAAVARYWGRRESVRVAGAGEKAAADLNRDPRVALLNWRPFPPKLFIAARDPSAPEASLMRMGLEAPAWQLEEGWYASDDPYRWSMPSATARLFRPEGARTFELTVNCGPEQMALIGSFEAAVTVNAQALAPRRFGEKGWHTARWDLAPAPAGVARVEFRVTPETRSPSDPRVFGMAVVSFGFPAADRPVQ